MDDHDGSARGHWMDSRANASRRGANARNFHDRVDRARPARVIVPEDKPESYFVAYFAPGLRREMLRASYHSYSKALARRMGDRFEQRFLDIFFR
jgi:hypothetical protein